MCDETKTNEKLLDEKTLDATTGGAVIDPEQRGPMCPSCHSYRVRIFLDRNGDSVLRCDSCSRSFKL